MKSDYQDFLKRKSQYGIDSGFEPLWMPDFLFDFQKHLVEWAIRKGRSAIFADCGLGKTIIELVFAENVVRKTNGRVIIFMPLAVANQTVKEAEKFGIKVSHRKDGIKESDKIVVTNYERLHYFNADDFVGAICDESSILKHYTGATQKKITRFLSKLQYRLLCTATAAPNDWVELGTSSEALGVLTHSDMLTRFFMYCDDKKQKKETKLQEQVEKNFSYYRKLAFRVSQTIGQWRLKNHGVIPFWRWVASWAAACRMPSDLGFDDKDFILPDLIENLHIVKSNWIPEGQLFYSPAFGLGEEREERRNTITERCEFAAELALKNSKSVIWCHYNNEGDLLEKIIPGALQIAGATPDDIKEEIYEEFLTNGLKTLIIKPKIGAWGLNWQHCSHVITFASHSYEQYYQSIRRCWRFGQKRNVIVDLIATEGEKRVVDNMKRKAWQAEEMYKMLINEVNNKEHFTKKDEYTKGMEVPTWS
jgi:hypothetical protein